MKTSRTLTVLFSTLGLAGCPADGDDMSGDDSTGSTAGTDGPTTGNPGDDDDDDDDDDVDDTTGSPGDDDDDDDDDDVPGTDSEGSDDGGAAGSLVEACEDYYATYDECFPQYAGEGYCDDVEDAFAGPCGEAVADYFACLSDLDCADLESTEAFDCRDEYIASYEDCDGVFAACQAGEGGGDLAFTWCDASLFHCVDDHTYGLDCAVNGGTVECTCTIDDVSSGMFSYEDTEALCGGQTVTAALTESCGWPADVASELE